VAIAHTALTAAKNEQRDVSKVLARVTSEMVERVTSVAVAVDIAREALEKFQTQSANITTESESDDDDRPLGQIFGRSLVLDALQRTLQQAEDNMKSIPQDVVDDVAIAKSADAGIWHFVQVEAARDAVDEAAKYPTPSHTQHWRVFGCEALAMRHYQAFRKFSALRSLYRPSRPMCKHEVAIHEARAHSYGCWYPTQHVDVGITPKFHVMVYEHTRMMKAHHMCGLLTEEAIEALHRNQNSVKNLTSCIKNQEQRLTAGLDNQHHRMNTFYREVRGAGQGARPGAVKGAEPEQGKEQGKKQCVGRERATN
jgi:hypothetical protein